jgi:hypothetical protein
VLQSTRIELTDLSIDCRLVFHCEGLALSRKRGPQQGAVILHKLKPQEEHSSQRLPLDRLALLQLGNEPPRFCYVSDISKGGLRMYTYGFQVPDEFVLFLSGDGLAQDGTYQVEWRRGEEIGAKFVSANTDRGPRVTTADQ